MWRLAATVTGVVVAAWALASISEFGGDGEAAGPNTRIGPVELFTKLHNQQALMAYCSHIGRVRKQKVVPCGPGAAHPCCTQKELEMEKMRSGTTTNFDWADPTSWSGTKGAAAQHLAHKAAMGGAASPAQEWQPAQQYTAQAAQAPPMQYAQAPAYGQQQPQLYWAHLLPGQYGVPEQGVPQAAPQQMYQPAPQPGYGGYVSPLMGPSSGAAPEYGGQYAQAPQQMYQPAPQYQQPPPQQQGYAPAQVGFPLQQRQMYGGAQMYGAPGVQSPTQPPQFQYPKI